jgi:UDP-N-acetylglucosamine--N-acetylmuramyl-(pentapeptide) pyrophosphoryl-undecaprenol N-acetylglucosamine transferase
MNVIFTCGGTGGHINPAIAVANLLKERHPDCKILFVGSEGGMEEKLVPRAGYELRCIRCAGLSRRRTWRAFKWNVKAVGKVLTAVSECKKIIRDFQPDVIVGTGGYASFPTLYAGSAMGIPTCVHEANAVPGLTTKLAAGRADMTLVTFEESRAFYRNPEKVEVVGMPVRKEFLMKKKQEARAALSLDDRPLVVSVFGSLGARDMNYAVADMLKLEQEAGFPFQHIHSAGTSGYKWMPEHMASIGVELPADCGVEVREYIYDMPTVMAAADLIISRAGASSCNEIGASGTPCILIPSPNVTNDHQTKNARILAQRGGAVLLPEQEDMGKKIYEHVTELLADPQRLSQMSATVRQAVVLDSAEQICNRIEKLCAGR